MPAFVGRFDLVVGNPPWVNWEHLPAGYRERTRPIWHDSGLFVHGGMAAMLGAGKKDVAMLLSYVASERLLAPGGRLSFVMTQTVFKTAGAGQGFRGFVVDDMVDLAPFAGATNRTAVMTWRRDSPTRYPVRYRLWRRRERGTRIPQHAVRDMVVASTTAASLVAAPVRADDRTSSWLTAPRRLVPALRRIAAADDEPPYAAHAGVYSGGANGVYWVEPEGPPDADGLVPVRNLHDVGRRELPQRYGRVEQELLYRLVRGRDIRRWHAAPSASILMVQDPVSRSGISRRDMEGRYPGTLAYLEQFEDVLRARAAFRRFFRGVGGAPDRGEYWSMFGVGTYTFAVNTVVWKDQASVFTAAVLTGADRPLPNQKCMQVACDSADEAHYLCALLNSLPVRTFVASYTVETQISTHVVSNIAIPPYDRHDESHKAAAKASRAAHRAAAAGTPVDEGAVDAAAGAVWGLSRVELGQMTGYLDAIGRNLAAGDDEIAG